MTWVLLGIVTAVALAVYPTVHRRRIRGAVVRHARREIAGWLTRDLAAPLLPIHVPPTVDGCDTAEPSPLPQVDGSAARREHFELTTYEIQHHRRAS